MATGIVSIDAHLLQMPRIAAALFWLNVPAYLAICALTALRKMWFMRELWRDLLDHRSGPVFFASVAATGVLGSQVVLFEEDIGMARLLWAFALVLWFVLTCIVFTGLTVRERKPALDESISGGWLLPVVGTQSIAVLSAQLAAHWHEYRYELNVLSLSMWLCGGVLYVLFVSLIFHRYMFLRFTAGDLSPTYWINMGAMAISTLAGSLLIANGPDTPLLASLAPFIKGMTLLCWATGTWWIPLLVVLLVWQHAWKRFPLRYDALYWGAVFPLGMYAACTFQMAHALALEFLYPILPYLGYVAFVVWAIVFIGFVRALFRAMHPG